MCKKFLVWNAITSVKKAINIDNKFHFLLHSKPLRSDGKNADKPFLSIFSLLLSIFITEQWSESRSCKSWNKSVNLSSLNAVAAQARVQTQKLKFFNAREENIDNGISSLARLYASKKSILTETALGHWHMMLHCPPLPVELLKWNFL